jgi:hypothetical protein
MSQKRKLLFEKKNLSASVLIVQIGHFYRLLYPAFMLEVYQLLLQQGF